MTVLVDPVVISKIAASSALAKHNWAGRGAAPIGYIKGMAVMFAVCQKKLEQGDVIAFDMAKAMTAGADNTDALAWYSEQFQQYGMDISRDGIDTLRHLFVLMYGLGMRESSGRYCEGRDRSASNTTSDTAEAGLFQMSWDASGASPHIPALLELYKAAGGGYRTIFAEGVRCTETDLANYGSGEGLEFQRLCKESPGFAVEAAAVGLRHIRRHWGPINRKEAELVDAANDLLRQVQSATTGSSDSGGAVADADDEMAHGVLWTQWALNLLGAKPALDMDGTIGPLTRAMLKRFQEENGLPATGLPDDATLNEVDRHVQSVLTPQPAQVALQGKRPTGTPPESQVAAGALPITEAAPPTGLPTDRMVANPPIAGVAAGGLAPHVRQLLGRLFG